MKKDELKKNILFVLWCIPGTIIDVGLLHYLVYIVGIGSEIFINVLANGICYMIGSIVAFFCCRRFAFKMKDNLWKRLSSTLGTHFIGFALQELLFFYLLYLGLDINVAKAITIGENAIVMFFATKLIVFRTYHSQKTRVSKSWVYLNLKRGCSFWNIFHQQKCIYFYKIALSWN